MRYVDFAYGRPGALNILNAGFPGLVRYLSRTLNKNLDLAEFRDYKAHNVKVHVVCQNGIADHDGLFSAGKANAILSISQLLDLGWDHKTGCIYFVPFDSNETSASLPKTIAYFQGINSILPVKNIGIYGDADSLTEIRRLGLAKYFWQSASKSFGPDVDCDMRQVAAQASIAGVTVDINNVFSTDTGAIFPVTGGSESMTTNQEDLRAVLNEANAPGFNTFAEMFNIDTPQSRGIVSLLRWLFNNVASKDQVGLVGLSLATVQEEIQALKDLTFVAPTIDYQKLAQALITEFKAFVTSHDQF